MIKNILKQCASLNVTFVLLLSLLVTILIVYNAELSYTLWLAFPLLLLVINLVAAIITNKTFQANLPLLFFHLSLLATVLLIALSRLTYLNGHVSLHEGAAFTGKLNKQEQGILHNYTLKEDDFVNQAVQLDFTPLVAVTAVRSRVSYQNEDGYHEKVIGEHSPLVIGNYRFYVTRNVGYSAVFSWQPIDKEKGFLAPSKGTIHFPPFLNFQFNQTNTWTIPDTDTELWMMLLPEEDLLAEQKPIQLTPMDNHYIVVRRDEVRHQIRVNQQLKFPEGALTYLGLRTWMGYKVHYEPFKAYLLTTTLLTILFLSWFYYQKFTRRSWLDE